MSANKHPELLSLLDTLTKERGVIVKKSAPLREERESLRLQITPAMDRIRALDGEIHAAERPRMTELDAQIAGLKKALGPHAPKESSEEEVTITPADVGEIKP